MLRTINYVSEMTEAMSDAQLADLVETSQGRNKAAGITGMLFTLGDKFIQVIEGPPVAVGALFKRIQLDPRHGHVRAVQDIPIETRAYEDQPLKLLNKGEGLTESERGMVFHALQAFEPRTVLGPKVRPIEGVLGEAMEAIMALALPIDLPILEAEALSELLYAAELLLLRESNLDDAALGQVAERAHVSLRTVQSYFPTIDDLIRTCVLRVLALEHQHFLSLIVSQSIADMRELGQAVTEFIINTNSHASVSPKVAEQFAIHGGSFTSETAWIIAKAVRDAGPRGAWKFHDLTTARLAMAIDATDAAARILARNAPAALADPRMRTMIYDICMTALEGGRGGERAAA